MKKQNRKKYFAYTITKIVNMVFYKYQTCC